MDKYNLKSIGGQFWIDDNIFCVDSKQKIDDKIIFDGAGSTIRFIIKYLNIKSDEYVLLPSYLCPTIVNNFSKLNVNIDFYKVDRRLKIDLSDLNKKVLNYKVKAVYIIDYFGIGFEPEVREYIKNIRDKGYFIIEDAVQQFWTFEHKKTLGDFIFNSLRKFIPLDGSILLTSSRINIDIKSVCDLNLNMEYLNLIAQARTEKKQYIDNIISSEASFLSKFNESEEIYEKNKYISILLKEQVEKISIINYEYIKRKRNENFKYVYSKLAPNKNIKFITDQEILSNEIIPLALVVLIKNRDMLRKKLSEERIFCPVHWNLKNEKFASEFEESIYVSENILAIPIDQRYSPEDYSKLIEILKDV